MPSVNWRHALDVHPGCHECFMLLPSELDKFGFVPHNQRWARTTSGSNVDCPQYSLQGGVLVIFMVSKQILSIIYMTAGFGLGGWMRPIPAKTVCPRDINRVFSCQHFPLFCSVTFPLNSSERTTVTSRPLLEAFCKQSGKAETRKCSVKL